MTTEVKDMPEGLKYEGGLCFGMRASHPGLFEIKIHNPKKKNAISTEHNLKLGDLITACQDDENVKVILFHGGKFFSSGNDLSVFAGSALTGGNDGGKPKSPMEQLEVADHAVNTIMVNMILAMARSVKPVVVVVRGLQFGIAFTLSSHSTFLYCSPDAKFNTPFMATAQSPEGTSTLMFPKLMGSRFANEVLLNDKLVTAQEAVDCGFANGIIDEFDKGSEWFDPDIIPVIPKLLNTDYRTLVNCME